MKVCQFNFNNEVDTFEIHVEDDGRVTVPGENGPLATYDSVQQLAEIYAQARDVKPSNLKNWTLLENGNVYSFVLRAGTAGVDVASVEEELETAFTSLEGQYHPLNIARAKEQIMRDGSADLVEVLVHCTETDIAREIYDAMSPAINGTEVAATEAEPVQEDTRSDLEKYIDNKAEVLGALSFIATLVGLPADVQKADVLAALEASYALSNVRSLQAVYDNAINDVINDGIGVENEMDALTVITQTAVGVKDDDMKNRMVVAASLAKRDRVNVAVSIVGNTHIRRTAEMIALDELQGIDLFVRDNVPYIVRFSDTVDAELEAERNAAAAAEDEEDPEDTGEEDFYDEDEYEEEYEEDEGEEY